MGPWNGISETLNAIEEPIIAAISGEQSGSALKTIFMICTSCLYPLGNSGRIGLSMRRAVNVASSPGRPSLFLNPPGILPAAYIFSS